MTERAASSPHGTGSLAVALARAPAELKAEARWVCWVCWRREERGGKMTKLPGPLPACHPAHPPRLDLLRPVRAREMPAAITLAGISPSRSQTGWHISKLEARQSSFAVGAI